MSEHQEARPIDEIAPDDFPDAYEADSVNEALEIAHRHTKSTTPIEDRPRCSVCGSVKVAPAVGFPEQSKYDCEYNCHHGHHFDNPVYGDDPSVVFEWVTEDDLAEPPLRRQLANADDRTLTALAIYLYRPWEHTDADPSYQEIADLVDYSRQWVGERVRAWEDGEYRSLVRDPRPRLGRVGQ